MNNNSMLLYFILFYTRSRGRTSAANFRKNLDVSLLIRISKTGQIWKALVQTVRFQILIKKKPCLDKN